MSSLSKKEKGRLKKLRSKAKFSKTSPGIVSLKDARELKDLLSKVPDSSGPSESYGPSIGHIQANNVTYDNADAWKQTEGVDHRKLIQSFIFGDGKGSESNNNDSKKRKFPSNIPEYTGSVPSWCKVHNHALLDSLAIVEFAISSSPEAASILPSKRIYEMGQDCTLKKLIGKEGCDGKFALPLKCRLFQGDRPQSMTDILMYVENTSNKKQKKTIDDETGDKDIDCYEGLSKYILNRDIMKKEGYPLEKDGQVIDASDVKALLLQASKKSSSELNFGLEDSKKIVATYQRDYTIRGEIDEEKKMFVETCLSRKEMKDDNTAKIFAVDCEMVRTTEGFELARITILEFAPTADDPEHYIVSLDVLVKPNNKIVDYVTKWSGITPSMLENVTTTLEEVQAHLLSIICKEDLLIGQSLENDLKAMGLIHHSCCDTAIMFKGEEGRKFSLKALSSALLKRKIQLASSEGHCSEEDAAAALVLAIRRVRLGDGFRMKEKSGGKKNLFSLITRAKRKVVQCSMGYIDTDDSGPIVGIGPNEWIQDHIASNSIVNALECQDVSASSTKAISSYLKSGSKKAGLLWAKLCVDVTNGNSENAQTVIDQVVTDVTKSMSSTAAVLFVFQEGLNIAKKTSKERQGRKNAKSTLGWSTEEEEAFHASMDRARNCEAFWVTNIAK
ncbi:hypothetical protein CTEN210_05880 [Chaetoceros tenuissimus]|uniref:Exonuclease domain-containing protein n=1 Tax=Chaetoceros tenuissimus TaxID=426638 RepID=A0AAD3CPG3_9STRA|nr:hypothetical protein CTEN210_05880 [Chaetoceros tenuissimus]